MTKRNEEALQIAGLLIKNGRQAKLIQSNEGFSLYNLLEIRYFLSRLNLAEDVYIIQDDLWDIAKGQLAGRFGGSLNLESCLNLIQDFEAANPKYKYKTDLEISSFFSTVKSPYCFHKHEEFKSLHLVSQKLTKR